MRLRWFFIEGDNVYSSFDKKNSVDVHRKDGSLTKLEAFRNLLYLSVPSVIGLFSRRIVEIFNYMFAGRLQDSNMIAGVGLGILTSNIVAISFGLGLSGALDTLWTQAFGNKNNYLAGCYYNRAQVIFTKSIYFMAFIFVNHKILFKLSNDLNDLILNNICTVQN